MKIKNKKIFFILILFIPLIIFLLKEKPEENRIRKRYFDFDAYNNVKLKVVKDGWIEISRYGMSMWYYKTNGKCREGWLYDDDYKGWYYFYPQGNDSFMFDPRYNKSKWIEVDNKLYWFKLGGRLKELSGWKRYGDKWMYHVPGDYGALAGCLCKIGSKYYIFDYNGYMTYEGNTAPDLSKLGYSR